MIAPLDDPFSYPGTRADQPFRLRGDRLEPLPAGTSLDGRRPVLAIGSNASPAQLTAKFRGHACGDDVLGLVVTVAGLQIRPSAHLSRHGYWPFAPIARDSSTTTAVLCLLDDAQIAVLDRTEPNYTRLPLDAAVDVPGGPDLAVDPVRDLGPVFVYVSRHGVIDDPRLPAWSDPPPRQEALLGALLRCLPPIRDVSDPQQLIAAVRARPELADEVTAAMKRHLDVRDAFPDVHRQVAKLPGPGRR